MARSSLEIGSSARTFQERCSPHGSKCVAGEAVFWRNHFSSARRRHGISAGRTVRSGCKAGAAGFHRAADWLLRAGLIWLRRGRSSRMPAGAGGRLVSGASIARSSALTAGRFSAAHTCRGRVPATHPRSDRRLRDESWGMGTLGASAPKAASANTNRTGERVFMIPGPGRGSTVDGVRRDAIGCCG